MSFLKIIVVLNVLRIVLFNLLLCLYNFILNLYLFIAVVVIVVIMIMIVFIRSLFLLRFRCLRFSQNGSDRILIFIKLFVIIFRYELLFI